MNVVGKVSSFITQGMYSVATPFHPFGGAVDIVVVKQHDGTFRSTPWYVRFGKFQGVLKGAEKIVKIEVNGVEADFHMYLDNSGEAYFAREIDPEKDEKSNGGNNEIKEDLIDGDFFRRENDELVDSDSDRIFYEFQDDQSSIEFSEYSLEGSDHVVETENSNSEVVLVSVDGHMLTAPISSSEINESEEYYNYLSEVSNVQEPENNESIISLSKNDVFKSCLELQELSRTGDQENLDSFSPSAILEDPLDVSPQNSLKKDENEEGNFDISRSEYGISPREFQRSVSSPDTFLSDHTTDKEVVPEASINGPKTDYSKSLEISLCGNLIHPGMGSIAASEAFESNKLSLEEFKISGPSIVKNENLIVRLQGRYLSYDKAAHIILGLAAFGSELQIEANDCIPLELPEDSGMVSTPTSRRWSLWPNPFRRVKTLDHTSSSVSLTEDVGSTPRARLGNDSSPRKQIVRTNVLTTDQIASLNLEEGQNTVKFVFSTRVLGSQKVEAHIYLWKWNTRIVISDVDGTITRSDVLGQFMPLVGKDWTHSGIARLFCAIKENGYQLLFLSARAIVQSYLTKSFLFNLKQDGKSLPNGPVVISPDGLFPSLYREVVRRAPHEFKIACLEDIKALFPPEYNPFYAGFGNRDTDELSYRKIGIPKGKIFIINPKGEVAINHRNDVKSYTSLHTLVNDMFPPTSLIEQEDYNSWNYWKMPLPDIDNL